MGWGGLHSEPPPPSTITDYIETLSHGWPLQISMLEEKSAMIAQTLVAGQGLAVVHGSNMPKSSTELGTAAWCIQDTQTGEYCTGVVQTSGDEREVNPYRSELQGIHMVLMAVYIICNFHQVTSGKMTVCCNNEKALWLSRQWMIQVSLTQKHVDLIRAICKLAAAIPIKIVFEDVTGHLDDIHHFQYLNLPSQLNVRVDHEAK